MTSDPDGEHGDGPDRRRQRSPATWDSPHTDLPETPWYHPRFLAWFVVDLVLVLRAYLWHKRRSLSAERWKIEFELARALRECYFIETGEGASPRRQRNARDARQALLAVADELSIESKHIEAYRTIADTDAVHQADSDDAN